MKNSIAYIVCIMFLALSCEKQADQGEPQAEREKSIPELVEIELMEILSHDWQSLSDTLDYFNTNLYSKGITEGYGPDGVKYKLEQYIDFSQNISTKFYVEDSTFISANGKIYPLSLHIYTLETDLYINSEQNDSLSISALNLKVTVPPNYSSDIDSATDGTASLQYKGSYVGYVKREEFENTDFSTEEYLVIYYKNDNRSFAYADNGLTDLFEEYIWPQDTSPIKNGDIIKL